MILKHREILVFSNQDYFDAIKRIKATNQNIHVVTHLIFGLPFETEADMLDSVKTAIKAKTDGIKIALLHVLKNTDLATDFQQGKFSTMEKEEYFEILGKALSIIPKDIVIHRLTGDGPKNQLIAPLWTANKKEVMNSMNKYFSDNGIFQGSLGK